MPSISDFFKTVTDRSRRDGELSALLPTREGGRNIPSAIAAEDVTKVALKLKYQIETVIPCELEQERVEKAHSDVITSNVVETAKAAGGEEFKACVVYCLLICKKWFKRQASLELWDADMHDVRAVACEVIAKRLIEEEDDMDYLLEQVLLTRFSTLIDGEQTAPANAVEKAVDLHALTVIGSSGYQKCIHYIWRGWLVQDDENPTRFKPYENKINTSYWAHLDPDRMRVPRYQNSFQVIISIIFLALFTGAINTINRTGDLDVVEGFLYLFTLGFIVDEIGKFWKVGWHYIGFWNVFNSTLYVLLTMSFIIRMVALSHHLGSDERYSNNVLSYNLLAFTAPMFWMRLLLYLDTFRFFGAMLVVVKVMMKESLIFFALLIVVVIGFLQAFIGLDASDDNSITAGNFVMEAMIKALLTSPEFDGFDDFGKPFGLILYYIYSFVVMVILLNILIALYNSAYEDITGNAIDEYMALFSQKCLQFVRAPDENVFIAPFNLIELTLLVLPLEWWMSKPKYERLNDFIMGVLYSPLLLVTAFIEQRDAWSVRDNRRRGEIDEDTTEEWEQLDWKPEIEDHEWRNLVEKTSPNVAVDGTMQAIKELKKQIEELKELIQTTKS